MTGDEKRAAVDAYLVEQDAEAATADGLDDAIVGVGTIFDGDPIVVYDLDSIAAILMHRDGMTFEEAHEFISYNITSAYIGPTTPLYLVRVEAMS